MSEQTKTRTQPGHRINVIGTTGAGKTTVAAAISRRLGVPHIEMDALFWKPHWVETPDDELFAKVDRATASRPGLSTATTAAHAQSSGQRRIR